MARFNSLQDIRTFYGIAENDPDIVISVIKQKLRERHPDVGSGVGESVETTDEVLALTDALNYLRTAESQQALVPYHAVTALTEAIKALAPLRATHRQDQELAEHIEASLASIKHRGNFPKITLSAITALMTALWLFPSTVSEHPVLKNWINSEDPTFGFIWLNLILVTVGAWVWYYRANEREAAFRKALKLEATQTALFRRFLESRRIDRGVQNPIEFSREEFVNYLMNLRGHPRSTEGVMPLVILRGRLPHIAPDLAEQLASTILARAVEKKVVVVSDVASLDDRYRVVGVEISVQCEV